MTKRDSSLRSERRKAGGAGRVASPEAASAAAPGANRSEATRKGFCQRLTDDEPGVDRLKACPTERSCQRDNIVEPQMAS
ncbi:MAG: hypothetical protein HY234_00345 [Acidobacteria bacterium]|nr:hypothetical protein [Acidobacteriota bacterium]